MEGVAHLEEVVEEGPVCGCIEQKALATVTHLSGETQLLLVLGGPASSTWLRLAVVGCGRQRSEPPPIVPEKAADGSGRYRCWAAMQPKV